MNIAFTSFLINIGLVSTFDSYFSPIQKIQNKENDEFLVPFSVTLLNAFIHSLLIDYFAVPKLVTTFTLYNNVLAFASYFIIQDIYFYIIHRILHLPIFYKYIHKMHHKYKSPNIYQSYYGSPIEHIISWTLPYIVLPYCIEINKHVYWAFVFYTTLTSIIGHCGNNYEPTLWFMNYNINVQPAHHDLHHLLSNCNYSLYFTVLDRFCGTLYENYEQYINDLNVKYNSIDTTPERIAWYNGSFSPPTNAHIQTALKLAIKFVNINKGKKCIFCIVPVSNVYKKASIQYLQKEFPNLRNQLCENFVEIIKNKALLMEEFIGHNIDFVLERHELDSPVDINPYDSVLYLRKKYNLTTNDIFIAQGQDNIQDFIKMKGWTILPKLMLYPVIMVPRYTVTVEENWKSEMKEFMEYSEPAYDRVDEYLNNLHFTEVDELYLNDSSTFIRELLRQATPFILDTKLNVYHNYINPTILSIMLNNKPGKIPYTSLEYEKNKEVDKEIKERVTKILF